MPTIEFIGMSYDICQYILPNKQKEYDWIGTNITHKNKHIYSIGILKMQCILLNSTNKIFFEFGARVLKVLSTTFFLSDTMLVFSQWMIWIVICKYMIQKTSAYTQLTKSNYL